jgi:hypothetical protein
MISTSVVNSQVFLWLNHPKPNINGDPGTPSLPAKTKESHRAFTFTQPDHSKSRPLLKKSKAPLLEGKPGKI